MSHPLNKILKRFLLLTEYIQISSLRPHSPPKNGQFNIFTTEDDDDDKEREWFYNSGALNVSNGVPDIECTEDE